MNEEKIRQSVNDVTDPTKNSINEKCARIREAFLSSFDETFAQNYYVVGERSTPKKVVLDRALVQWPEVLNYKTSTSLAKPLPKKDDALFLPPEIDYLPF